MKRLTPEERERQWENYFNQTGDYAETNQPPLCVDTQIQSLNTQPTLRSIGQCYMAQKESLDFKKLEREVTIKTLIWLAAFIFVFYWISRLLN